MARKDRHSFCCKPALWERVQKKAGLHRVSAVIRTLLIMWLDGKIEDLKLEDLK